MIIENLILIVLFATMLAYGLIGQSRLKKYIADVRNLTGRNPEVNLSFMTSACNPFVFGMIDESDPQFKKLTISFRMRLQTLASCVISLMVISLILPSKIMNQNLLETSNNKLYFDIILVIVDFLGWRSYYLCALTNQALFRPFSFKCNFILFFMIIFSFALYCFP